MSHTALKHLLSKSGTSAESTLFMRFSHFESHSLTWLAVLATLQKAPITHYACIDTFNPAVRVARTRDRCSARLLNTITYNLHAGQRPLTGCRQCQKDPRLQYLV